MQGEGRPGVLLEAGTDYGGTEVYPAAFVDPLVARTRVCTYDRLGTGRSDPPAYRRRTMRDLCAVQDQVLAKLQLRTPYVLVGESRGGNVNIGCAARHPDRVAGLVTIDSPHDHPDVLRKKGLVWTDNREFVDYVDNSEELETLTVPIGDFRVLVITPRENDPGGEVNQGFWLYLSPNSRQVTIDGPHHLHAVASEELLTEILKELGSL